MPAFNLSIMLSHIIDKEDLPHWRPSPAVKRRLPPDFCVPASLPSTSMFSHSSLFLLPTRVQEFLQREAESIAPKTLLIQSQHSPSPPSYESIEDALSSSIVDASPTKSPSSPVLSSIKQAAGRNPSNTKPREWTEPEVRRATLSHGGHSHSFILCD